jgi:citrate lyase subunit beta / citryl-CoA lyase
MSVVLTLLYAPADRVDRARKALATGADVVILDLEDAVAATAKDAARDAVPTLVAAHPGRAVQIRVNAGGTPWAAADLRMVAAPPPDVGVRVPKVVSPDDVAAVRHVVGDRQIHCLLENAAGVEAAADIAGAPGVASIGLGEADLRSDLGVAGEDGLTWCRQRIVVAARAAGLQPPSMAVYTNVADLDGLAASTAAGRRLGFVGRTAIHPRQLPVIVAAFRPDDAELGKARATLAAVVDAEAVGSGTSVLPDGSFLDAAMVEYARRVVALAERVAATE